MMIHKPGYSKFVFAHLDEIAYSKYASRYATCKKVGFRSVLVWLSGNGVLGLVLDVLKGKAVSYGKEKLGVAIIGCVGYACSPVMCLLTNTTAIIKNAKRVHNVCAFAFECLDDYQNAGWLPVDMILFGQPISIGDRHRFEMFGNFTSILDKID